MKPLFLTLLLSSLAVPACANEHIVPAHQRTNQWYKDASAHILLKPRMEGQKIAKNVILFIGDGMGISTVTAARILAGQQLGELGEESLLSFERFPYTGLSKTYNVNAQTPDSAGTMTAIISGVKTNAGLVGADEHASLGKCGTLAGSELVTALELAELAGKRTGIVTTTRVTHATPAATYAKSADRDWEDNAMLPEDAKAIGCEDIASQLIGFEARLKQQYPKNRNIDGLDLVMGGGRRHFLPADKRFNTVDAKSHVEGRRTDGRNLIDEWQQRYPSGRYIIDQQGFDELDTDNDAKLLALFNESHMQYEADRHNDIAGEPSLSEMTEKAIKILSKHEDGFFLMIESGRIDLAHHAGNAFNALNETVEFSRAVDAALKQVNIEDTLLLVTADHSHVFSFGGYAKRGNPVLGKVIKYGEEEYARDVNGKTYTSVSYANGLGFANYGENADPDMRYSEQPVGGRQDLTNIDTTQPGFHQETLVPLEWETHGGEDVAIYAVGPGAELVAGVNEQNVIFHIINHSAQLEELAKQ